jgi:steroid delta-isomerase-like uncharacterized protein
VSASDKKRRVSAFLEKVWNAHDTTRMAEHVAEDAICEDIAVQVPLRGLARWRAFVDEFVTAFPDLEVIVFDQIQEGDQVVTRWRAEGTHQAEFRGIAPTQKRIGITAIAIDTVGAHGKIVHEHVIWDLAGMLRQLGAIDEDLGEPTREIS